MAKKALEAMSDDELTAENYRLQAERTQIGEQQEAIIQEYSRRKQERRAVELVEGKTPEELQTIVEVATAAAAVAALAPGEEG